MMTIPSGTALVVRTTEDIDSRIAGDRQTFSAVVDRDLMAGDSAEAIAIPKSSPVDLAIRNLPSSGTAGTPNLALDIDAITINGDRYVVSRTSTPAKGQRQGNDQGSQSKSAAANGGVVGEATSGAPGVSTKGTQVQVPADTVLTFLIAHDVTLESDY
jgi:hypothetical protein